MDDEKNQGYNNAYYYAGGDGEIKAKIIFFYINIPRQFSQKRDLKTIGKENTHDHKDNPGYEQEFTNRFYTIHVLIIAFIIFFVIH